MQHMLMYSTVWLWAVLHNWFFFLLNSSTKSNQTAQREKVCLKSSTIPVNYMLEHRIAKIVRFIKIDYVYA